LQKVQFFVTEVKFLDVIYSKTGRKNDPDKVKAIDLFPEPRLLKMLQEFLGMCAYLSSFVPHFSTKMFPLYDLLRGQDRSKNGPIQMTKEAKAVMEDIKEILAGETILYNINYTKPVYCVTDASNVGCGSFIPTGNI
jgi:hypothetical protein